MNANTDKVEESGLDHDALKAMKEVSIPLKAAIETIINELPVEGVFKDYDGEGVMIDREVVAADAATFVLKGLIGSLCYNVIQGYTGNGQTMLNRALDQVDQAAERDASTASNQKTQDTLHARINWACQMDVQQSYRKALQEWTEQLYCAVTGDRYPRPVATSGKTDSPEAEVARNLRDRIAERGQSMDALLVFFCNQKQMNLDKLPFLSKPIQALKIS